MSSLNYDTITASFEKHGFETHVFPSREAARDFFVKTLDKQTIGFGGSVTLQEMGLYEALRDHNAVTWHNKVAAFEVRRLANSSRIYITSANAVTESGEIVNIDGTGNRVAMTAFGPDCCYFVVGRNKITSNLEAALHRAKHVAAPKNAQRLGAKTPCAVKGDRCYDCSSPGRICRVTAITERVPMGMKCVMVFVDEDLGY